MNRIPVVQYLRSLFDRDRSTVEQIQTMRGSFARLSDAELGATARETEDQARWFALAATAAALRWLQCRRFRGWRASIAASA